MRTRWMWVLGLSVATLSGLQGCGSDGGASAVDKDDGSAGNDGTGARSSGGRGGMGGAAGAGGMMPACNTAPCDQQFAGLQGLVGMLGGGIMLKSCCVNATTCGIDTSAFGALLGGIMLPGCVDPSTFLMPPPAASSCDMAVPPASVKVLDGGVIPVPEGQPDIQLDKTCPCLAPVDQSVTPPAPAFSLPGCCRPNGTCGGSSHTLVGAGTTVDLACISYQDVASAAASSFGSSVVVPADPKIACKYTLPSKTLPEAGVPDASTPTPTPVPDASKPDASKPGPSDSGKAPEAGTSDATPADATTG